MQKEHILNVLEKVFKNVFDDDTITINEEITSDDIENWDSIGQIYLMAEIEEEFNIKLSQDFLNKKKVKDIILYLQTRL